MTFLPPGLFRRLRNPQRRFFFSLLRLILIFISESPLLYIDLKRPISNLPTSESNYSTEALSESYAHPVSRAGQGG